MARLRAQARLEPHGDSALTNSGLISDRGVERSSWPLRVECPGCERANFEARRGENGGFLVPVNRKNGHLGLQAGPLLANSFGSTDEVPMTDAAGLVRLNEHHRACMRVLLKRE
jgi:hypothetical protein